MASHVVPCRNPTAPGSSAALNPTLTAAVLESHLLAWFFPSRLSSVVLDRDTPITWQHQHPILGPLHNRSHSPASRKNTTTNAAPDRGRDDDNDEEQDNHKRRLRAATYRPRLLPAFLRVPALHVVVGCAAGGRRVDPNSGTALRVGVVEPRGARVHRPGGLVV